jgi:mannose-6-phosphate isomerase-like protein (cupin superfamily)
MSHLMIEEVRDPESNSLLHKVLRIEESANEELERVDFSDPTEYLQGAMISIPPKHEFRAHIHIERSRDFSNLRAQESWVVIRGTVEVDYYADDGEYLTSKLLGPGDVSISFRGGHGYRTLTNSALVYEFKSGPYEGQALDKRFIEHRG